MTFTPRGIDSAIRRRKVEQSDKKPFVGEEGVVNEVDIAGKTYAAKEWRGTHRFGEPGQASVIFGEHVERSPASPYWFKLKKMEYGLMHRAVPDSIVPVVAGYDPRYKKTEDDGWEFDPSAPGRPVTVMPFVAGDDEFAPQRNAIVQEGYAEAGKCVEVDEEGIRRLRKDAQTFQVERVGADFDEKLEAVFGILGHYSFDSAKPKESLVQAAKLVREQNSSSPILPLLEAGILPHHPEWNFLPTGKDPNGQVQGVILEASIADTDMLSQAILQREMPHVLAEEQEKEKAKLEASIDRFLLYRELDRLYDELINDYLRVPKAERVQSSQAVVDDVGRTNRLVTLLECVRENGEGKTAAQFRPVLDYVQMALYSGALKDDASVSEVGRYVARRSVSF